MTASSLRTLRNILRELRLASPTTGPVREVFGYKFLLDEYRKTRNADEETVKTYQRDASYYLCLLKNERVKKELHEVYKGKGERPVEEVARMVGFKLPKTYDSS
ncbi:protein FMC1 homolog [Nematostella vectensis]|uniref:protein FMC1 homolog n=1 Tax=Nematostella vectensis TaxID=45351 RepID=UPI00207729F0|nr:protein FMC1 homolog [Nematostella vectensis]